VDRNTASDLLVIVRCGDTCFEPCYLALMVVEFIETLYELCCEFLDFFVHVRMFHRSVPEFSEIDVVSARYHLCERALGVIDADPIDRNDKLFVKQILFSSSEAFEFRRTGMARKVARADDGYEKDGFVNTRL